MSDLRNRHWRPTLTAGILPALISAVDGSRVDLQILENLVRCQKGFVNHDVLAIRTASRLPCLIVSDARRASPVSLNSATLH